MIHFEIELKDVDEMLRALDDAIGTGTEEDDPGLRKTRNFIYSIRRDILLALNGEE